MRKARAMAQVEQGDVALAALHAANEAAVQPAALGELRLGQVLLLAAGNEAMWSMANWGCSATVRSARWLASTSAYSRTTHGQERQPRQQCQVA